MNSSTVQPNTEAIQNHNSVSIWQVIAEALLIGLVCFAYAGQAEPNVNETHYLTKAKHFWNPDWCKRDLFLASSSPHLLFHFAFGWLTLFMSLPNVAWIGRILCWSLFAFSWKSFTDAAFNRPWYGFVTASLFLLLLDKCHLAGEWIIGGVESKGFAFAFVFWALASIVRGNWPRAWVHFGIASAFHVLVGGWACLAAMLAFGATRFQRPECEDNPKLTFTKQIIPLALGGTLALIGIIPPLMANWSSDYESVHQANLIMVTQRLGHHQWFEQFSTTRVAWFVSLVFVCFAVDRILKLPKRLRPLRSFAFVSLLFCVIGVGLSGQLEQVPQSRAADFLIYYWFRLSDFAIPLLATVFIFCLATPAAQNGQKPSLRFLVVFMITAFGFSSLCMERWSDARPIAVQRSHYSYADQPKRTRETFENWQAACQWIQDNTPPNSLFLTPARQQTFKWYAHRAEVVNWKDVPQDAESIQKWYQRIQRFYRVELAYPGGLWAYTDEQLREISQETGATHLMTLQSDLDTRSGPPTSFRQVYPESPDARVTFVVFELRN